MARSTHTEDGSQLPHYSANEFSAEKKRHLTEIRNSPPRYMRQKKQHPYEANQPQDPHYSHVQFEDEKRVCKTDIRASPYREDRVRRSPPTVTDLVNKQGPPYHLSHQQFSIEKSEHFTPILPVSKQGAHEARSPENFRHRSHQEMKNEVKKCKTPIYPVPTPASIRRDKVVDNYLNYKPHPDGFLHTSGKELAREKKGHLTELHQSQSMLTRARSASVEPRAPSPADHDLFTSQQTLKREKVLHRTGMHSSTHRSRSAQKAPRDMSPQYMSVERFSADKSRHLAEISPKRSGREAKSPRGHGYTSHFEYDADKLRHSTSPQPNRQARADKPSTHYCSHTSNTNFTSEKRRHITDIHNSPTRTREPAAKRSPSAQFTSNAELKRAKRGHTISVGASGEKRSVSQQVYHRHLPHHTTPPPSPQRVYESNHVFTSEKRGHHTGIGNVHTPTSPNLSTPPTHGFKSHSKFSESKKMCKADLSPPRQGRSPASATPSPQRMVSQAQFRSEKAKHSIMLDSPLRRQEPQAPATPSTVRSTYSNRSRERERETPRTPSSAHRAPSYERRSRSSDGGSRDGDRSASRERSHSRSSQGSSVGRGEPAPRYEREVRYVSYEGDSRTSRSRSRSHSEMSYDSRSTGY